MLPAILKQTKYGKIGALALLLIVGGVLFFGLARMSGPKPAASEETGGYDTGTTPTRQMKGFVDHYGNVVDRQAKELSTQSAQLDQLKKDNDSLRKGTDDLRAQLEEMKALLRARDDGGDPVKKALEDLKRQLVTDGGDARAELPARIRKVTISTAKEEADRRRSERQVRLPAGSFVEVTLLTGVYAPTDGAPLPVKLRIDRAFVGPNRTTIPLQEAFLIGKAIGEPNSERVVIQLDRLSYVKPGGGTIEVPINGYVADDDGVQGVAGQYVWRAFDVAGLGVLSGALSAGADAFAAKETVTQVNPLGGASQVVTGDTLRFAGFRGAARAGEGIEKLVVKRLEEIVPAVYVANGRRLTACLIDGVTLEGLFVDEMIHEHSRHPFSGLDLDR